MDKMTFKEWCELNGRAWTGNKSFEEFKKNAKDYEAYIVLRDLKYQLERRLSANQRIKDAIDWCPEED